jgi:hypothetical protein
MGCKLCDKSEAVGFYVPGEITRFRQRFLAHDSNHSCVSKVASMHASMARTCTRECIHVHVTTCTI